MRDVQDWNKYVDMLSKAVSKRPAPKPFPSRAENRAEAQEEPPEAVPAPPSGPPRKGRGPRRQESREELLRRLLDPTLTLDETARMLGVCSTTVRRYTNKGILPHERSQGNQRRFKLSSVLAFIEAQGQDAADQPEK